MTLREKILNFLQWNDRNGCYLDEYCKLEGFSPLTLQDSLIFLDMHMNDYFADYEDIDINNLHANTKQAAKMIYENVPYRTIINTL